SHDFLSITGPGGTTSATGLPWRVTRMGSRVLRTCSSRARHLALNSEIGTSIMPAYLRTFVEETRLTGLRFNFDIGHAHLADGPTEERVATSFASMREHIVSAHIHDNLGDKDAHLAPHDGSIDWPAALKLFRSLPG